VGASNPDAAALQAVVISRGRRLMTPEDELRQLLEQAVERVLANVTKYGWSIPLCVAHSPSGERMSLVADSYDPSAPDTPHDPKAHLQAVTSLVNRYIAEKKLRAIALANTVNLTVSSEERPRETAAVKVLLDHQAGRGYAAYLTYHDEDGKAVADNVIYEELKERFFPPLPFEAPTDDAQAAPSMEFPIRIEILPDKLAKLVREASEDEFWGDAMEAFEDWLDETAERPPAVLVMLAWMTFEDALDIMVDEVEERGELALALLDEAKLDNVETQRLRRRIETAVRREKERSRGILRTRNQPLETMDRRTLRDLACELGKSKELADQALAARAWKIAAQYETEAHAIKDCIARAALACANAQEWEEAIPWLEEILAASSDYDGWVPDYACYRLLDKAISDGDISAFRTRWATAVAMTRAEHFPFALSLQEKYLAFAIEHRLIEVVKHLVDVVMTARSPRERKPIASLLAEASTLIV
jgi:hypothetical protein